MNRFLLLAFFLLTYCCMNAQEYYMFVGTYDSPKSEGIYLFKFNSETGVATSLSHVKTSNPSFLTISPDKKYIYAVHEAAPTDGKGGDIASFVFDRANNQLTPLNRQLSGGDHPCHVEIDQTGKWVFASNYSSGTLSMFGIHDDGSLGTARTIQHTGKGPHPSRQKGPHVHGSIISPNNKTLFVTDLGIDRIMCYSFDAATGKIEPSKDSAVVADPGAGPRLLTFHPSGKFAYVIEELSGTVVAYRFRKNKLERMQRISSLTDSDKGDPGSADVHVSPDGNFLYASNRGDINSIAIYSIDPKKGTLALIGHHSTLGKTPRNFCIDPTGNFLLCANQNSDEIVIFRIDRSTGMLSDSGHRIAVGKPVCLKMIE